MGLYDLLAVAVDNDVAASGESNAVQQQLRNLLSEAARILHVVAEVAWQPCAKCYPGV